MKYILLITTIAVVVCFSSCNTVLKTAYGIKKPRLETIESIHSFQHKSDLDSTRTIVFKDLRSFVTASQQDFLTIPDAIFFNSKGHYVSYNKTAEDCNANVDAFISDLKTFDTYPIDESIELSNFAKLLTKTDQNELNKAEINVFITWTVYAGRLNDEKAFEWVKLLENAKANGANINYYLLNCDYQESWNIPKEVQKKLGIKS